MAPLLLWDKRGDGTNFANYRINEVLCLLSVQIRFQELTCIRFLSFSNVFGRAGCDDIAAVVAAFGAEVDDVVGGFDDVEVVFDDDDGVASVDEAVEGVEEFLDVG